MFLRHRVQLGHVGLRGRLPEFGLTTSDDIRLLRGRQEMAERVQLQRVRPCRTAAEVGPRLRADHPARLHEQRVCPRRDERHLPGKKVRF